MHWSYIFFNVDVLPENIGPRINSKYPFFLEFFIVCMVDSGVDSDFIEGDRERDGGGGHGDGGGDIDRDTIRDVDNESIMFTLVVIFLSIALVLFILNIIYYIYNSSIIFIVKKLIKNMNQYITKQKKYSKNIIC